MDDIMPGFSGTEQSNTTAWSPETATLDAQAPVENPFKDVVRPDGPEIVLPQVPDSLDQTGPAAKFNFDPSPAEGSSYNAVQVETSFPEATEEAPEPSIAAETAEVADEGDPEATSKEVEDLFAKAAEVASHIDEAIKNVDEQIAAENDRHETTVTELKDKRKRFEESKKRLAQLTPEQQAA